MGIRKKIFQIEGVRLVVRASVHEDIEDYDYTNGTRGRMTITKWKNVRLDQYEKFEFEIIDGKGNMPHGGTLMRNLRNSYSN